MIESNVHALKRAPVQLCVCKRIRVKNNSKWDFTQCFKTCNITFVMLWGYFLKANKHIYSIYTIESKLNVLFWKSAAGNSSASRNWRLALLLARFSSIRVRAARSMDPLRMTHRPFRHRGFCDPRLWLLWRHQVLMEKDRRSLSVFERNKWIAKTRFPSPTWHTGFLFPYTFFFFLRDYYLLPFLLVACYMWMVIVDHGRLCVSWQAKFLSRKYSIYWP